MVATPYVELPLEALLLALGAGYLGMLQALMAAWQALKGKFWDTTETAVDTAATGAEVGALPIC